MGKQYSICQLNTQNNCISIFKIIELNEELNEIMKDRFSKDTVIALATISQGIPHVQNVNAYYEIFAFILACSPL